MIKTRFLSLVFFVYLLLLSLSILLI